MAEKTLHKIGDTVFVFIPPSDLVDPEQCPIFEVEITGVSRSIRESAQGKKEEVWYEVEDGLSDATIPARRVFLDRKAALDCAEQTIIAGIEKLERMLVERRAVLALLR